MYKSIRISVPNVLEMSLLKGEGILYDSVPSIHTHAYMSGC